MKGKSNILWIGAFLLPLISACSIGPSGKWSVGYSLNGASIPAGTKTASVQYFQNRASIVQPTLAQLLTEKLKDKIMSQTNLKIVNNEFGDANFEGVIEYYNSEPKAISGGDEVTASLNRLEIRLKVKYTNSKDGEFDFDTSISRFVDYDANMLLEQVEKEKLDGLVDLLVEDIFNKAFVNW
jgi:hypothetical protein